MMNLSFINSIIGLMPREFKISSTEIPEIYMAFSLCACLSIPCTKFIRSKYSLKSIYNFSIFVIGFSFLLAFDTRHWYLFCLSRAIQGFFLTALYSISFVEAISKSENKDHVINFVSSLAVTGLIIGPLLSGALSIFNWRLIYLIAIIILLAIYCFSLKLPNEEGAREPCEFSYYEYFLFVSILFCIAFSIEIKNAHFYFYVIDFFLAFAALAVFTRNYIKSEKTKLFNKSIFNRNLFYAAAVNFSARFALIGTPPLASLMLNRYYAVTIPKISIYLAISAIASLIGKFAFKIPAVKSNYTVNYFLFIGALLLFPIVIALGCTNFGLILFFSMFGLFSSLIFNYVNASFYFRQPSILSSEATSISNIFQLFFYGMCVNILFLAWFGTQKLLGNTLYSLLLIMLGMSFSSFASLLFYRRLVK